jgi:hypothetical protein
MNGKVTIPSKAIKATKPRKFVPRPCFMEPLGSNQKVNKTTDDDDKTAELCRQIVESITKTNEDYGTLYLDDYEDEF